MKAVTVVLSALLTGGLCNAQGDTHVHVYVGGVPAGITVGGSTTTVEFKNQTEINADLNNKSDNKSDNAASQKHQSPTALHQGQSAAAIINPESAPIEGTKATPTYFERFSLKHVFMGAAGIVASCYVVHRYMLYKTTRVLRKKNSWCNWKHETPFEQLCTQPHETLSEELLNSIQEHNPNPHHPADHIHPITRFLEQVQTEVRVLSLYKTIIEWEKKMHLARLFPGHELEPIVTARLEKLAFLKKLFFEWARTHRTKRTFAIP